MDLPDAAHRPWPLPHRPWVMAMQWYDLLFMHWPVPPALLCACIPPALALETFEGTAWLGITPFRMAGARPLLVPPLAWLSAFPALNVRTYVTNEGKPGVWCFSLDAGNWLAVRGARTLFHLPYYTAAMVAESSDAAVQYISTRTHRGAPGAAFAERYCLYTADRRGRVWRGDIHHARWPLQPVEASVKRNTMADPLGSGYHRAHRCSILPSGLMW